jgi:hypothetical protein
MGRITALHYLASVILGPPMQMLQHGHAVSIIVQRVGKRTDNETSQCLVLAADRW